MNPLYAVVISLAAFLAFYVFICFEDVQAKKKEQAEIEENRNKAKAELTPIERDIVSALSLLFLERPIK